MDSYNQVGALQAEWISAGEDGPLQVGEHAWIPTARLEPCRQHGLLQVRMDPYSQVGAPQAPWIAACESLGE